MKIIVIDDVIANLRFMERLLVKQGYQVITESNPAVALDIIEDDPSIRAVAVDYMMPEMTGMEFFQRFKDLPRFQCLPNIEIPPCILITAWSADFTSGDALHMGFFKVLKKPFSNETLLQVLEEIRSGALFRKKTALFVKCPPGFAENINAFGKRLGYQFTFSEDYDEALALTKGDNRIGTVFCYDTEDIDNCASFAKQVKSIKRYDSQGELFVPFVVMIASKLMEASIQPFWDNLLTEPGNYRNLVVTMHEQHSAKNAFSEDPSKMVLVQGDIGINTFFLEKTVSSLGFNLMSIETPKEAFQILNSDMGSNIALVLCPEFVKEYPVEEFLAQCMAIRKKDPLFADKSLPFIVVAESQSKNLIEHASELGINKVFSRPINLPSFRKTLEEMLT